MIRITPREHDLLVYAQSETADLSRDALASIGKCVPTSIGRILTSLTQRGLIDVERGPHRTIKSITPTFPFERNKTFIVGNPPRTQRGAKS